jgi:hypothetical protein
MLQLQIHQIFSNFKEANSTDMKAVCNIPHNSVEALS